ncbi:Ubiquinone/menaquinone biosynthesis C-methylase UbiE [Desulfocicer vacuolatum DSM 3385]|uniref:Ubiquinone/menaquinone biosynthesis C-methylase UbiE n=1 Tax=Desulfocicer vacuolatum DSM 3385 TaxID=1121400 RepID=A0A1W2ENU1_9BACT|nr:class I SAM-dependent methyltransferase [Desulfocicer vacuolatum]SMD10936.1 Ubiquinone/menaquinone biosynthesis C-methylase UbiE [Desulfocicer vacuolatum DSM 3385]
MMPTALYQTPALKKLTGPVLRPGGLELTRESVMKSHLSPGDKVLDVGCGSGAAGDMLNKEFALNCVGIDVDLDLFASATKMPAARAYAQALPFKSNSLKAVFCECVLSLTPDMGATLGEFYRVLAPGGQLILCDVYLRNKAHVHKIKEMPLACGFRKGMGKTDIHEHVAYTGFQEMVWEDLSYLLTQLAGQAIFEHGSLEHFWARVFGGECKASGRACDAIRASRPGYFRIIARKPGIRIRSTRGSLLENKTPGQAKAEPPPRRAIGTGQLSCPQFRAGPGGGGIIPFGSASTTLYLLCPKGHVRYKEEKND